MIHDALHGNPSIVNYDIFAATLSMLSLFYLIPATIKEDLVFNPLIMIGLDLLNTFFFLCGALAMAGYLGVHSCDNQVSLHGDKKFTKAKSIAIEICPQQLGHQRFG